MEKDKGTQELGLEAETYASLIKIALKKESPVTTLYHQNFMDIHQ